MEGGMDGCREAGMGGCMEAGTEGDRQREGSIRNTRREAGK